MADVTVQPSSWCIPLPLLGLWLSPWHSVSCQLLGTAMPCVLCPCVPVSFCSAPFAPQPAMHSAGCQQEALLLLPAPGVMLTSSQLLQTPLPLGGGYFPLHTCTNKAHSIQPGAQLLLSCWAGIGLPAGFTAVRASLLY